MVKEVPRDTKPQYSLFMDEHYLLPRFHITFKVETDSLVISALAF